MNSLKVLSACCFILALTPAILAQADLYFGPAAGSQTYSITSPVSWSVTDNASWLTVSPTSGSGNAVVTVTVTANTSTSSRTGIITISAGGYSGQVTVRQAGVILSASPTSLAFGSGSESKSIALQANVSWSVSDDADWVTVAPTSGTGDATLTVTVAANGSVNLRSATLTLAGGGITTTVSLMQGGVTLTVSPTYLNFGTRAGSSTISIHTSYPWTVSDDTAWLTVSPASGAGEATVTVTVTDNPLNSSRIGTVTVSGGGITVSIMVTQDGIGLVVSPMNVFLAAGSITIPVLVECNIDWIVTSFSPWISITPASGSGNTTLTVNITANTSTSPRSGTFAVSAWSIIRTISITQSGAAPILDISPDSIFFGPYAGDSPILAINSNTTWSVTDDAIWLSISPASGSGIATATVSVSANTQELTRSGTIMVSGGGITRSAVVLQEAPILTVSSDHLDMGSSAQSGSFSLISNLNWHIVDDASWITVSPVSYMGMNPTTVTVTVSANETGNDRSGTITVSGGGISRSITVTQFRNLFFTVSPGSLAFGPEAGSQTLDIASNTNWSIYSDGEWITASPTSGSGSRSVMVAVTANTSTLTRKAALYASGMMGSGVSRREVRIQQQGMKIGNQCAGYALEYDGKDDYVDCGNDSSLAFKTEFTLCAWIFRKFDSGDWERILAKSDEREYDYWLQLKPYEHSASGGIVLQEGAQTRHLDGIQGTPVPLNQWVHIAVVYDGNRLCAYRNGVQDKSRAISGLLRTSSKPVFIGRLQNSYNFTGLIDEVALWNRALSLQEIRENMHCKYPSDTAHLQAHWHFDEGDGPTVKDQTIHQNHGTIHGAAWRVSTVPVSSGKSQTMIVDAAGPVKFKEANLCLKVNDKNKTDTLVVSELTCVPMGPSPVGLIYYDSTQYWIFEKYGPGTFNADFTFALYKKLPGPHDEKQRQSLVLLHRPAQDDGNWTPLAQAAAATSDSVTFRGISVTGQFAIGTSHLTKAEDGFAEALKGWEFGLAGNYPNPFNSSTTIEFRLAKEMFVTLKVFNLKGQPVATLVEQQLAAGIHRSKWDSGALASGIYVYRLQAGACSKSKKLIIMR